MLTIAVMYVVCTCLRALSIFTQIFAYLAAGNSSRISVVKADDFFAIVYIHEKFINATQVMTLIMINYVLNNSQLEARAPILSADAICTYNFSECIGNF